jgi:hypothetical protein
MARKRTFKEFKQGEFKPIHKDKILNKEPIIYRSGLELKVMLALDGHPVVKKWGSEVSIISYFKQTEQRDARYFIDFTIIIETPTGFQTWLVEVKPDRQTREPTNHGNKKSSTILYENLQWTTNQNKWDAAEKYAKRKGWHFAIMTEKNIDDFLSRLR